MRTAADEKHHQRTDQKTDGSHTSPLTRVRHQGSACGKKCGNQRKQQKGDHPVCHSETRAGHARGVLRGNIMKRMKSATKRKKRIFAMPVAVPAMPPNPKAAATKAITKKDKDQLINMITEGWGFEGVSMGNFLSA